MTVGRPYTPDEDRRLLGLLEAGKSHSQVARALGRPTSGISKRLEVLRRPHHGWVWSADGWPAVEGPMSIPRYEDDPRAPAWEPPWRGPQPDHLAGLGASSLDGRMV